jgi:hypothetical protein
MEAKFINTFTLYLKVITIQKFKKLKKKKHGLALIHLSQREERRGDDQAVKTPRNRPRGTQTQSRSVAS